MHTSFPQVIFPFIPRLVYRLQRRLYYRQEESFIIRQTTKSEGMHKLNEVSNYVKYQKSCDNI